MGMRPAFGRWARSERGSAAAEFALIAPVLLTLMLGALEIIDLYRAHSKATLASNAVADLVSRTSAMDNTERDLIFAAANAVLDIYGTGVDVEMVVTSIERDGTDYTVCWSEANGHGTARTAGDAFDIDAEGTPPIRDGESIILAEVGFTYTPRITDLMVSDMRFDRFAFRSPRYVPEIAYGNLNCD